MVSIVPRKLERNYADGCYTCHGKCLIKLSETKKWRKATMHGSPFYCSYDFEIEPCDEFPQGGRHILSTDHRWNTQDVDDIRMVPDSIWHLPVLQDVLTEKEILIMDLKKRCASGEPLHDSADKSKASDWKIVCVGNDSKYGRIAYSPSLDIMRQLTFDEFYGGGIVD